MKQPIIGFGQSGLNFFLLILLTINLKVKKITLKTHYMVNVKVAVLNFSNYKVEFVIKHISIINNF